jgi:hypothetical protein
MSRIRRRLRIGLALTAALLAILLVSCYPDVAKERLTPWFEVRRTFYTPFTPDDGGNSQVEYYVRVDDFPRWRKLDALNPQREPIVVDADTVGYYAVQETDAMLLIDEGAFYPRNACGDALGGTASVPPKLGAVDCVTSEGETRDVIERIYFRRLEAIERASISKEVEAGPGRRFMQAAVSFYDEQQNPYLVTWNGDENGAPQCALVGVASDPPRVVDGSSLPLGACLDEDDWTQPAGTRLRKAR